MRIQSARELKRSILDGLLAPRTGPADNSRVLGLVLTVPGLRGRGGSGVSIGISAGTGPGDVRIAVRTTRRDAATDRIVAGIADISRGEVEVVYVGRVAARTRPAARGARPVPRRSLVAGLSVGHLSVTAGTLGAVATGRYSGARLILSNNHVLSNENRAAIGDGILQPGTADGGVAPADTVAALSAFEPLRKSGNLVDAAVAAISDGVPADPTRLPLLGKLRGVRDEPLDIGDAVAKVGRTTGLTRGFVTAIELDALEVEMDTGRYLFDRQIEIGGRRGKPFSAGGDSGALIVDAGLRAAGLLFAGTDQGGLGGLGLTYANEIRQVLDCLEIDLAPGP